MALGAAKWSSIPVLAAWEDLLPVVFDAPHDS
jgi:hypothetical protein